MVNIVPEGQLFPCEIEEISKLPGDLQSFGADHSKTLAQIGCAWDLEPLPDGYEPQYIDFYVEEQDEAIFSYSAGEGAEIIEPHFIPQEYTVFAIEVDLTLRYVEIRGKEVFNRIGGCQLPQEINFLS